MARAQGVRVRLVGLAFLGIVGVTAAEATQAVGALLLLELLSAPAGAAYRLTSNPYAGLALSAALALFATWGGLLLGYLIPSLPPSSAIVFLAFGVYVLAAIRPARRPRIAKLESVS